MGSLSPIERNADLVHALIPHLSEQPWFELAPLARAAGISEWTIRRVFGHIEPLYRSAFSALVRQVLEARSEAEMPAATVIGTIQAFALAYADLMRGPAYRGLLQLLLQNGTRYPWMVEEYESVLKRLASALQRRIGLASESYRTSIGIHEKTAVGFVRTIEVHAGLRQLLPGSAAEPEEIRQALKPLIAQTYEATYRLDWVRS